MMTRPDDDCGRLEPWTWLPLAAVREEQGESRLQVAEPFAVPMKKKMGNSLTWVV